MEEQIHVLIVEDEGIVAMDLAAGLEAAGYNVVGIADNGEEAAALFAENPVDILLMDIHILGDEDGVTLAERLLKQRPTPVIYLSAFTDSGIIDRVKQTHPSAFLTKPYTIQNVRIAIELALNNFATALAPEEAPVVPLHKESAKERSGMSESILQLNGHIFIKNNYRFVKVKLDDILYVEADNNYVNLITTDKKYALRLSLNQLLDSISFKQLVRIHRSYAVNIDGLQSFTENEVVIGKQELPIGRNYKDDFLKHFRFN